MTDTSATPLRQLYEDPSVPVASGPDRAKRQLAMVADILDDATARGTTLRILDIGCGDGAATSMLAQRARGHTVVGVDWSTMALERAGARGLHLVRGSLDGAGLPFPERSVDMVFFSEVIEHLVDTDAALEEIIRVLRPGGSLLLSTPNLAAWFNRGLLLGGIQPVFSEVSLRHIYGRPGSEVVGHLRLFTRRSLVGLLRGHDLHVVSVKGARYHDTPRPLRPLDRLFQHLPSLAADLLVHARTPEHPHTTPLQQEQPPSEATTLPISRDLLALLACPVDKGPLIYHAATETLYNPRLRRGYRIVDGIPQLLADQASPVDAEGHRRILHDHGNTEAEHPLAGNPAGIQPSREQLTDRPRRAS